MYPMGRRTLTALRGRPCSPRGRHRLRSRNSGSATSRARCRTPRSPCSRPGAPKNGVKIVKVAELLRRLCREDDRLAHFELRPVRRDLAQRRLGASCGPICSSRPTTSRACSSPRSGAWTRSCSATRKARTPWCLMGQNPSACFFYRTDLLQPNRGAQDPGRSRGGEQEAAGRETRLKWGYVGGMAMKPHMVQLVLVDVGQQL